MKRAQVGLLGVFVLLAAAAALVLFQREDRKKDGGRGGPGIVADNAKPGTAIQLDPGAGNPANASGNGGQDKPSDPPRSPRASAIAGFVRDVRGSPVQGARVRVVDDETRSATSAADGSFRLELAPSHDPMKRVALLADAAPPLEARVLPGVAPGSQGVVILLRPGEGRVAGRVVRARDHAAVPGARLEASLGDWLFRGETGEDGRFKLAGAPDGTLTLVVSKEGLVPRLVPLVAERGDPREKEIALESGQRVSGRVVSRNVPVQGAVVSLRVGGVPLSFEHRSTTSDERGSFEFLGLPAGESTLRARTSDGVSRTAVVRTDGAHDPAPVTLELGPGVSVSGCVSSGGAPVGGARLSLRDRDDGTEQAAVSKEDGRFRLEPVAESARLELVVQASGYATKRQGVRAGANEDVLLSRAASLALVVSPGGGVEASVRASDGEEHALARASDTSERADLSASDLPPGPAWILARAPARAPEMRPLDLQEGRNSLEILLKDGLSIEGKCVGEDGSPVAGASVVAIAPAGGPIGVTSDATSSEDGRFVLRDLPRGKRRLVASVPGYLESEVDADSGSNGVLISLARSYGLEVRVAAQDAALPRAFVRLVPLEGKGEPQDRVLSGVASAVFDRLRGAKYRVEAFSPGFSAARVEIDPRQASAVDLQLGKGAKAAGVVLSPEGKPLPGAAISLGREPNEDIYHEGAFATLLKMTEEDGTFEVVVGDAGEDVVVTNPECAPLLAHIAPGEGQKLQLAPGSRLFGRTLGRDGSPQGGIGVVLEGPLTRRSSSKPDGTFVFKGLLAGRYRVRRHDAPPDSKGTEVSVGNRGESSVELREK